MRRYALLWPIDLVVTIVSGPILSRCNETDGLRSEIMLDRLPMADRWK